MLRLLSATVSAIIFTALLCLLQYTPKDEVEPGVYHFGLGELFTIYLIYIAPIYLTLGIGVSWTADQYIRGKFRKLRAYVLSGAGITGLIAILAMQDDFILPALLLSVLLGAAAALVYWLTELWVGRICKKSRHVHRVRA
ncbi:hypothetical protein C772_00869 [Bhargavaea cecembensis DSE10]|uniref:Uncharacterized protein n=1 Tax=Bhargavaea cecembensis DSE10 TaxID=1235279 RepID=M7P9R0_9BACL|nr:hypothetical protein C772_00869 [Bhargavaea cecembensis DSE10]